MNGVIHRDIKPANLPLSQADGSEIKVCDFGAAVLDDTDRAEIVDLGSPAYMSPEQVREEALTHHADIYP